MDELPSVESLDDRSIDTTAVDLSALADLMARVLAHEGVPPTAEASLSLVDPQRIADLKAEYLGGDGNPTDVLSFPIDGIELANGSPDGAPQLVGDVVICPSFAAQQAPTHAGTMEDELALLVVHGSLHLLGWDHDEPDRQNRMWKRERELMEEFHRSPARDPWSDQP